MLPVLLNVGPVSISSFGVFLAISLVVTLFTVWRVSKSYDVDEERVTSLTILTFLGGLIGARAWSVFFHPEVFTHFQKIIEINRYPGLSFWGGLFGGALAFWLLVIRNRLSFWSLADFAAVGYIIGLAVSTLGCFLGGCGYGVTSDSPFAVSVVGLVGKRLPVSLVEALILFIMFRILWKRVLRFHYSGQIAALMLIWLGTIKFISEFFRGDSTKLLDSLNLSLGHALSLVLIISGVTIVYTQSKRSLPGDVKFLVEHLTLPKRRTASLSTIKKRWYNLKVSWQVKLSRFQKRTKVTPKLTMRRLRVKSTPKNFR